MHALEVLPLVAARVAFEDLAHDTGPVGTFLNDRGNPEPWAHLLAMTQPSPPVSVELLPGTDPEGRYRLTKWPQTEREYPRHFRIATAMMKGPATLAEIAEASGSPLAEVADFTNANLATGFAEFVPEPEPEAEAPRRAAGFFSRLRGRT